ncbi:CU044_5270 family protein [Actinomadura oligospora]|uniref:CU044_5270 family protein n=1 Tax=Actinomadura oligospora TaxID=111804 RepID=UPI00047C9A95|nr:CU044_5270 family protein [Actinomadura oligospora]
MNELKMIEQIFAEPKAGPEVAASGRARLLRLANGDEPDTSPRSTNRRTPGRWSPKPRWRWVLGAGLPPVVAAGVAAVMLAGNGAAPASPTSDRQARHILLAAATRTAAAAPAGRYFRFSTEAGRERRGSAAGHRFRVVTRVVEDLWYSTSPGVTSWESSQELASRPATPADAEAWRAAGSPAWVQGVCSQSTVVGGSGKNPPDGDREASLRCQPFPMRPRPVRIAPLSTAPGMMGQPPSGLNVAKLSDDTATLRRQLLAWTRSGGLMGPVEGDSAQLWTAALYLIAVPIGPVRPAVRAAAYRVLADLPDVRSLGMVTDQRGRRGQALTRIGKGSEGVGPGAYRLVIDPRTGAPLESGMTGTKDLEYTSVLDFGYTDQAPPIAGK